MAYTTINKSTDYFNTILYTGDGSSGRTINVGFQSDFVWYKERGSTDYHTVFDVLRGATKRIFPNATEAESTNTESLQSFVSNGYTIGNNSGTNGNGDTYVSWNWLANGAGSANTDGSINTTYTSVNTTAGFSISTYTGTGSNATIGHGLGAVPQMVIARNITDAEQWTTYHVGLDATAPQNYHVRLNTSDARVDEASVWNDTAPTSSVFSIGSSGASNGSGDNHIAYCFAEKQGYSKFGSYTGNGNADGTFVYTGFKPAFIITKSSSVGQSWQLYDNKRNTFNQSSKILFPNLSASEQDNSSAAAIDILSNGFKQRVNDAGGNGSGATYIYMAFASAPLVGTNNVPATAR
tara:strand:- start:2046 stop:3098 length:1053 start_codon:yes stop_codon:yes gene_type:complete